MFNKKLPQPTMKDIENAIKKLEKEVIYLRSKLEESDRTANIEDIDSDIDSDQYMERCYEYYLDFQKVVNSMNMFRVKNKLEYFPKYTTRPDSQAEKLLIDEFKSYVINYVRASDKLFNLLCSARYFGYDVHNKIYEKVKNTVIDDIFPYANLNDYNIINTIRAGIYNIFTINDCFKDFIGGNHYECY